jgi:hypothetical protein
MLGGLPCLRPLYLQELMAMRGGGVEVDELENKMEF